jgi:hypothetical protein
MSGSRGKRNQESPVIKYVRRLSERTHPLVPPALMVLALFPLATFVILVGPMVGSIILLGIVLAVAVILEVIEQAQIRGWL